MEAHLGFEYAPKNQNVDLESLERPLADYEGFNNEKYS